MYQLYKGDTPLATFVPKDASELPYSNGVSVKDKIDSMEEVVTHQNQDQTITIYTQGKHADLYLDANTTTGVPLAGLQLPDNIKPKKTIYFVGKAGDYWNQAYRITSGSGLLTARDGADREDVAVQWARGHVSFIMQ
ncbi:MAG: hypothetical protein J6S67_15230 [Methanobrevibacter sp.]|nr:hypothetical protein [Methanobrevibacter sp.]